MYDVVVGVFKYLGTLASVGFIFWFVLRKVFEGKLTQLFTKQTEKFKSDLQKQRDSLNNEFTSNLEFVKSDLSKQRDEFNQGLTKQTERFKQELSNRGHNSQFIFDFKVKIYSELNEKLIDAVDASSILLQEIDNLPSDKDELEKELKWRDNNYVKTFNEFTKCQRKYEPFYDKDIFNLTDQIINQMNVISINFRRYLSGKEYSDVKKIHEDIKKQSKEVSEKISNEIK